MIMLTQFPDWYRTVHPEPSSELLKRKWKVVDALRRRDRVTLVPDMIRLAFGRSVLPGGAGSSFSVALRKNELDLKPEDVAHETRVMAGAALAAFIESDERELADRAALAVLCVTCAGLGPKPLPADLPIIAENYLLRRRRLRWAKRERLPFQSSATFPGNYQAQLASVIKNPQEGYLGGQAAAVVKSIASGVAAVSADTASLGQSTAQAFETVWLEVRRLREETIILWWMFGEQSSLVGKFFREFGRASAVLQVALEMAELTDGPPGPLAAPAFLARVLQLTQATEHPVTIEAAIAGSDPSSITKLCEPVSAELVELTPVHAAAHTWVEFQGDASWTKLVQTRYGIDVSAEVADVTLALQCYHERLLRELLQPLAAE
ncbi:GTPase-associated system all-helical protein GASH [Longimicrobium sp.]|jgi:hypothetical protein|uniref:GTPase-associated system all-helical protein GASH n=1 Tax=Longimicrobium sp. TaxID=2029185 RepID=UPI002ED97CDD